MKRGIHSERLCSPREWAAVLAILLLLAGTICAQSGNSDQSASSDKSNAENKSDQKPSGHSTTRLKIHVTSKDGKPVSNASVYVRYSEPGGLFHHDKLAEMSLKTNEDGAVKVPPVPQGKILIQVVAKGWHTYGKWYEINDEEESIEIVLEPPPHWY